MLACERSSRVLALLRISSMRAGSAATILGRALIITAMSVSASSGREMTPAPAAAVFSKSHEGHSIIFIDSPVITITKSSNLPELSQRRPPEQNTDDYCNNSRKPQDLTRASRNDCVRFTPHFIWPLKLSSDLPFLCESPKILCQKLAEP